MLTTRFPKRNAPKKNGRAEQNEIESEMGGEAPVFARMTEATAGDVEATDFAATVATMKDLPNRVAICVCRRPNAYHDQTNCSRLS